MRTGSTCVLHGVEVLRYRQGTGAQPGWCDRERGTGVLVCEGLAVVVESRLTWWAGEWPHMWPWLTQGPCRGQRFTGDCRTRARMLRLGIRYPCIDSLVINELVILCQAFLEVLGKRWIDTGICWNRVDIPRGGMVWDLCEFRAQLLSEGWRGSWERVVGAVL